MTNPLLQAFLRSFIQTMSLFAFLITSIKVFYFIKEKRRQVGRSNGKRTPLPPKRVWEFKSPREQSERATVDSWAGGLGLMG